MEKKIGNASVKCNPSGLIPQQNLLQDYYFLNQNLKKKIYVGIRETYGQEEIPNGR